jgi:hypothetical protein
MPELAHWDNFYVIVGSAAGALIGLQFVVVTLIADRPHPDFGNAASAFGTPTVVHFSVVLFLSALVNIPWQTIFIPAALWGSTGLVGVIYELIVARRMKRQKAYKPLFEDWFYHVILPIIAYAALAVSACAVPGYISDVLLAVGAASLVLLFVGIHNAWDNVSYHIAVNIAGSQRRKDH